MPRKNYLRLLFVACLCVNLVRDAPQRSIAQEQASSAPQLPIDGEDVGHERKLLDAVRDNVFSFDDPAFYAYCKKVRREGSSEILRNREQDAAVSWKSLLERPSDFRGALVTVEGRLEARHAYVATNRPGVGLLHQCELSNPATRGICTVVVIEDPANIPHAATVRAKGYFIKTRAYRSRGGEVSAGPLVVAPRLLPVSSAGQSSGEWLHGKAVPHTWIWTGVIVLFAGWFILRRSLYAWRDSESSPERPMRPMKESPQDFDWLTAEDASKKNRAP